MRPPRFWNDAEAPLAKWLKPLGRIYGDIVAARAAQEPAYMSRLPVICVGNVTVGGAGKTPVVQSVVRLLKEAGKHPAVLLRGYGGDLKKATVVEPQVHTARQVGDEALLHAAAVPTVVSRDRAKGAQLIEKDEGATHIVMDDGLQNPSLKKTLSLLVVDGKNPFGNECLFPAGPLREHVDGVMRRVQALIVIGPKNDALLMRYGFLLPIFQAHLLPVNGEEFRDKRVTAFAGIGRPQKFFDTLRDTGAVVADTHLYGDHHVFSDHEIAHLKDKAARGGEILVTTRKDYVRLTPAQRDGIRVLDVALTWEDERAFKAFLQEKGML